MFNLPGDLLKPKSRGYLANLLNINPWLTEAQAQEENVGVQAFGCCL